MTRKTSIIARDGNSAGEFLPANDSVSASTLGGNQGPATQTQTASLAKASTALDAAVASAGYPDSSNTGVPAGTQMTSYSGTLRITQNNAVISNMVITGDVIIDADNVTLKNCKIISTNDYWAVRVMDGASGFKMTDSEVDGQGRTANGVNGFGTFLRNDIHGAENGINVTGPSLIQDNYVHGLLNRNGSPHYDGIQVDGGHNVQILHNTVINDHGQTAAIMLDNYFDGLSNITVDGNRLVGGGYTVYVDGSFDGGAVVDSSIRITNNQIGGGGYGDFAFYDEHPVVSGNTGLSEIPRDGDNKPVPDPDPDPTPVVIRGTEGDDVLPKTGQSNAGDETYLGLGGNDTLRGGAGADILDGGNGNDTASYAGSNAAVNVNLQAKTASGGHATGDKLLNIENLTGSSYGDTLTGNSGNNVLDGGAGADKLAGGAGNDTYVIDNVGDIVTEASNAGTDTVRSSISYTLTANVENLVLTGTANINGSGNASANTITGNAGANILSGGGGNDIINGGGGADTLLGGAGRDMLTGGPGHDILTGGGGADKFVFDAHTLGSANADRITDFDSKDLIAIDIDGASGTLSSRSFVTGTSARDANDYFIFDSKTASLYYDADGSGSGGKVLVATFDNGVKITADDIWLF